jgi:hypothetical protein
MYLSEERVAVANRAIHETFEQACVAWQVLPHWETGDPTQTQVRNDNPTSPAFLTLTSVPAEFDITLAEAISPTPDALIAKVIANTVLLAGKVDTAVFPAIRMFTAVPTVTLANTTPATILNVLIDARAKVEKSGHRAASCLITDVDGIKALSQLVSGYYSVKESLLDAGYVNSLQRVDQIKDPADPADKAQAIFLGRRQRIAHGDAMDASPGEEPVDLAVSVPPSLKVVGDTPTNNVRLRIRISYATRVKDVGGIVVIVGP